MNRPPRRRLLLRILAAGLAALVLLPPSPRTAHAQEGGTLNPFRQGTHLFRRVLHELQFEPLSSLDELRREITDPRDTALIVLGRTDVLGTLPRFLPGGLNGYVREGGAVLVASDQAMTTVQHEMKNIAGVWVTGHSLRCKAGEPDSSYRGLDYCPFLRPVPNAPVKLFDGPVTGDRPAPPLRVATNLPSMLAPPARTTFPFFPGKVRVLAELPAGCAYEGGNSRWIYSQPLPAVAGGFVGQEGKGQVLVLADHSIFINEMMLPSDNGNVEFAYNCLEWLHHGSGRPRRKALFIEEGQIATSFNPLLIDPSRLPPGSLPQIIHKLDQVLEKAGPALADIEQENRLNDWLEDRLNENLDADFLPRAIVLSLAGLLLFYGLYRIAIQGRYRPEPAVPLLERAVAQHTPDAPLVEQRLQAMLHAGNLWESAHNLALQYFTAAGAPAPSGTARGAPSPPAPRPPRVAVEGSWWHRWRTRRHVLRLWRLAYEATPRRISAARLRQLIVQLEELKAALADGSVRLL